MMSWLVSGSAKWFTALRNSGIASTTTISATSTDSPSKAPRRRAAPGPGGAHVLVGHDGDRGVERRLHTRLKQQRHLDDRSSRIRRQVLAPGEHPLSYARPQQPLEPLAVFVGGKGTTSYLPWLDRPPPLLHGFPHLVALVQLANHVIGGQHCRPQPLERGERSALARPDAAGEADEGNAQAVSSSGAGSAASSPGGASSTGASSGDTSSEGTGRVVSSSATASSSSRTPVTSDDVSPSAAASPENTSSANPSSGTSSRSASVGGTIGRTGSTCPSTRLIDSDSRRRSESMPTIFNPPRSPGCIISRGFST